MNRWIATDADVIATWPDRQLIEAYALTRDRPTDTDAEAIADEMFLRGLK